MIISETADNSKRLFIPREELPESKEDMEKLFYALDAFSVWGDADIQENDYLSWEFDVNIPDSVILKAVEIYIPMNSEEVPF